jgi:hypothetical protein
MERERKQRKPAKEADSSFTVSPTEMPASSLPANGAASYGYSFDSIGIHAPSGVTAQREMLEDDEQTTVQMFGDSSAAPSGEPSISTRIQSELGGGQALDSGARGFLEPKFGHSFENIRIHADGEADSLSRNLGARAFTTGQDIFFRSGAYQPGSSGGQHLLAHELTHTIQQCLTSRRLDRSVSDKSDSAEVAARATADAVMAGQAVSVAPSVSAAISMWTDEELEYRYARATPAPLLPIHAGNHPESTEPGPYGYLDADSSGVHTGVGMLHQDFQNGGSLDLLNANGDVGVFGNEGTRRLGIRGNAQMSQLNSDAIFEGGFIGAEGATFTANAELSAGEDGLTLGAQANTGSLAIRGGTRNPRSPNDFAIRAGASHGPGLAARWHWGDGDRDGNPELGFGFDYGITSFDATSENPIIGGAIMGAGLGATTGNPGVVGASALLGAVAGTGVAAGTYLSRETEVGTNTLTALSGADQMMGDGTANSPSLLGMDEYRQQEWASGNHMSAIGLGITEGAAATGAAVTGLAESAWDGASDFLLKLRGIGN